MSRPTEIMLVASATSTGSESRPKTKSRRCFARATSSVETREEIYSSFGLITVQRAYSLVTRDGVRLPLGVMAENWGAQMRFDQAAAQIAARAQTSVIERGAVRVGGVLRAMIRDVPPWSTHSMTLPETKSWHRRAAVSIQLIMLLVGATALLRSCLGS